MRIGAGRFKGKLVPVGPGVRPTGSRLREALFDILGPRVRNARVLDLFAGSGALGLEALSRGALEAVLVEVDPRVLRVLRRSATGIAGGAARVVRLHLPRQLPRLLEMAAPFDLIFADPPYRFDEVAALLRSAAQILARDGLLVLEHATSEEIAAAAGDLMRTDVRRYGESCLSFYERPTGSSEVDSQARK